MRSPEAEKGAWNVQNTKFYQAAALTSFGVASFVGQQRAGGPVQDPGSINVRSSSLACESRHEAGSLPLHSILMWLRVNA